MAKTRSSGTVTTIDTITNPNAQLKLNIDSNDAYAFQILILPKGISEEARIITLENPKGLEKSRYLICPLKGIHELKKISAPQSISRSVLLSSRRDEGIEEGIDGFKDFSGHILNTPNLLVATAIDPLFIILPALAPLPTKSSENLKRLFLSAEDYVSRLVDSSPQFESFSRMGSIRILLEQRIAAVCDTVEAGDEKMYRLNDGKLLDELMKKAQGMAAIGLPPSMEEKLVRNALEAPMLGVKREESHLHELAQKEDLHSCSMPFSSAEKVETTNSLSKSHNTASSLPEGLPAMSASVTEETLHQNRKSIASPDKIEELLRFRVSLFFILSSYIAPHIGENLRKLLPSSNTVNFKPLDDHLTLLTGLRQDALARRSMNEYVRKRTIIDDDETGLRSGKRRKEKEDNKMSVGVSRGVKALQKVNVTGMKKMDHFFKKK